MNMTGEQVDLTGNQVIPSLLITRLLGQNSSLSMGKTSKSRKRWSKDFITDHVPNQFNMPDGGF